MVVSRLLTPKSAKRSLNERANVNYPAASPGMTSSHSAGNVVKAYPHSEGNRKPPTETKPKKDAMAPKKGEKEFAGDNECRNTDDEPKQDKHRENPAQLLVGKMSADVDPSACKLAYRETKTPLIWRRIVASLGPGTPPPAKNGMRHGRVGCPLRVVSLGLCRSTRFEHEHTNSDAGLLGIGESLKVSLKTERIV